MRALLGAAAMLAAVWPSAVSAQKGKPTVGIYNIEDVAQSGQGPAFSAMIETAITNTSKFRVIERSRLNKVMGEQALAKGRVVTTNTPGKVGGFEGADYLIYGTITTISSATKSNLGSTLLAGMLSNSRNGVACSNSVVTLGVDIKITDSNSGEVKYVTRINESQKSEAACGGSAQVDATTLLRSAADKVATGLVTAIYPIQIAAVQQDGVMVLNYGEGAIQPGAVMGVYAKGAAIVDPATGETIGNDEVKLGLIQVSQVTGRISKAVAFTPFANLPPVGSIVRPASPAELQALAKARKKR